MMTLEQQIITIGVVVAGTMVTRFCTFILFPEHRTPPRFIRYLGTVLPAAVIGLLVIYCLKDVRLFSGQHGLPELISIGFIVLLYLWKKNTLACILLGTVLYMGLVQFVFV